MNAIAATRLSSISDIRHHFARNTVPYYFTSASNFNLMGMHDWVGTWLNLNLLDCYDGTHPQVLCVADDGSRQFKSIEDINLYLLDSTEFRQRLAKNPGGKAVFLFFDEAIEALCLKLGLELILPPQALVRQIDSKIVTTEIGNQAGVRSVPNILTRVGSWSDLQAAARAANLGERLVVQTAFGDSGKTTFFIDDKADYDAVAADIEAEDRVKVMRRIRCAGTAIEACTTRWGTFVGPLLTELIGAPSLTPYPGGWCGNELYADAFSPAIRRQALEKSKAIGDVLYKRGYRGYFELDYLIDLDSGELFLGELNARITGISAMTNMSDFSHAHVPLFLFHLLEYERDIDLALDVEAFNQSMLAQGADGTASQVILKYTEDALKRVTEAPSSGVYEWANGRLRLKHPGYARRDALGEDEAYLMRIMPIGDFAYHGSDLAIMFMNRVIRDAEGNLTADGERWVGALKDLFAFRHLTQEERSALVADHRPAGLKDGRGS